MSLKTDCQDLFLGVRTCWRQHYYHPNCRQIEHVVHCREASSRRVLAGSGAFGGSHLASQICEHMLSLTVCCGVKDCRYGVEGNSSNGLANVDHWCAHCYIDHNMSRKKVDKAFKNECVAHKFNDGARVTANLLALDEETLSKLHPDVLKETRICWRESCTLICVHRCLPVCSLMLNAVTLYDCLPAY